MCRVATNDRARCKDLARPDGSGQFHKISVVDGQNPLLVFLLSCSQMVDENITEGCIRCMECDFVAEIESGDDAHPVDVMNEHRRETGHKLQIESWEVDSD